MKFRTAIGLACLLGAGAALAWWWQGGNSEPEPQYRTARIERGVLTAVVSASGTINPVASVQIGSQVSGQLRDVLVDFNSEVTAGQVIARIAPETFEHRVGQARADLEAARAQVYVQQSQVAARRADVTRIEVNLAESRRDLQRKEDLLERNFIAVAERDRARSLARAQEQELNTAKATLDVAIAQVRNSEAVVRQREAALRAAQVDLDRTVIRSPVDGVVIKRSVDAGQTVAASLQSPELFVIARNLRDMQVDSSIDETDIGRIRAGQKATFTVDSHPGRRFEGMVSQLRMAATNVQNVITYNVIVTFSNPEGLLLPGMTANVRIATETRDDVLKVPNAALRLRIAGLTDTAEPAAASGAAVAAGGRGASRRLWLLENGKPRMLEVRAGLSDGLSTEVSGPELQDGAEVIVGAAPAAAGRRSTVLRMF
ncbi:MAG: HlyD family secretion protein [Burkholderiales bacterium]|nr:MAG: HlyD family secretion protein [Burkholderiales bacterium]